jgi:serine protease Do
MAKTVMESLITKGKVTRGWLGVTIQSLTPDLAKQFNLKEEKGVLIGDVVEGGPAEKAGLQRGDVIVEFEGKKIEEPTQLRNMVANTPPNKEISLKIIRENTKEIKKATISELPADMQKSLKAEYNNLLNGVSVQELTTEMSGKLRLPKKLKGVIVSDVDEGSPAAMMLLQGDIIQEINRQKITNVVEYEKVVSRIKPGNDILLLVFRGGSSLFITLSDK